MTTNTGGPSPPPAPCYTTSRHSTVVPHIDDRRVADKPVSITVSDHTDQHHGCLLDTSLQPGNHEVVDPAPTPFQGRLTDKNAYATSI